MRVGLLKLSAAALLVAATLAPGAADAQYYAPPPPPGYYGAYRERGPRWDDRRFARPRRGDGRGYYRRCDRGTGGTIIGAIAGGLLGNSIAGRGDRTLGTVAGAGAGALAGRAIDRDC